MEVEHQLTHLLVRLHQFDEVRALNDINVGREDLADQLFDVAVSELTTGVRGDTLVSSPQRPMARKGLRELLLCKAHDQQFEEPTKETVKEKVKLVTGELVLITEAEHYHHV